MIARKAADIVAAIAVFLTLVAVAAVLQRPDPASVLTAVVLAAAVSVPLVGAAAVRGERRNPVGWMLLVTGIALPVVLAANAQVTIEPSASIWIYWIEGWPATVALDTIPLLALQLYPDGRTLSRRWNWLLWAGALVFGTQILGELFAPIIWDTAIANPTALSGAAGDLADALSLGIVFVPVIATLSAIVVTVRWRRARAAAISGVPFGLIAVAGWLVAASWWVCIVVSTATGNSDAATVPELAGVLAVGVAGWIGIRRYGLFDTRAVLGRGLVSVVLGVCVVGVYLGVAWLVEQLTSGSLGPALGVLAAVAVALPLWRVLQTAASRLLFGDRDDPVRVLERLGARVADVSAPDRLLPDAIDAIRDALRLPGVELVAGSLRIGAVPPSATVEEFPLLFAGERIGELRAAHREQGDRFRPAERSALTVLASQLSGVAQAIALTVDLRRSRERIVVDRERERRRITRDLHDGLGARLGSLVLGLQRARTAIDTAPSRASEQLDELTEQVRDALEEVRRLVYELRPPALDELGLVGALEEQARRHGDVEVVAPAPLGSLPAAVEVAAYRIVVEAMTNAARHAPGARTTVRIDRDGGEVVLRISDSGPGMPEGFRAGVGIRSMRERAAELDGALSISTQRDGGTLVHAQLPLVEA
ncbi:sensor histidine kinase [uncultured Amnibacterium sp.]|uniref:sensor histidine kinase n=1 Tax=uncultured Amnibacterium sp. TaxID=1631851 RepID=UPI0035CAFF09